MHVFWHSYGFFLKLVIKLTLRKPDNNFEAAQRKIRKVKNTHPKISQKCTAHTLTHPLQRGIFGFSNFENNEKKDGVDTHVYKMMLKSDVVTFEKL